MGLQDGNRLLIIFILFFTCICTPVSSHLQSSRHDHGYECQEVNCLMGTCRETPGLGFGFDCDCYSGWTKLKLLNLTLPLCFIPNCTIDYQCGGETPMPLPPPPPFQFPPPLNLSTFASCFLVWCGDGECVASGKGHKCECPQGSTNFLGLADLPCFQQCNLGADCSNVAFVSPATPPLPMVSANLKSPPPPPSSAPARNGSAEASICWRDYHALLRMLLVVAVLLWI
ncbi:hypothetical protein BT93_F3321 [Corymbia citriodora subsp. variegata]|nr:hypothetical protein BT93_F3321 [Corymbia citriodora subsp. variegata]